MVKKNNNNQAVCLWQIRRRQTLTLNTFNQCYSSPKTFHSPQLISDLLHKGTFQDFPIIKRSGSSILGYRFPPFWGRPACSQTFHSLLAIWHPIPSVSLQPARLLLRHDRTGGGVQRLMCKSYDKYENCIYSGLWPPLTPHLSPR